MHNITVSDLVWKRLREIKHEEGLKHFGDVVKHLITENTYFIEQTIKQKLLDLMNLHPNKTWMLPEFAGKTKNWLQIDYNKAKKYIEPLLSKIPEIIKVGDNCYQLKDSR